MGAGPLCLFREVEGGVAREKVERSQLKLTPNRGEYRPVFGPDDVMHSERVPEHDIRLLDGTIIARPGGEAIAALALVRIGSRRVTFPGVVGCHPKMEVRKTGTGNRPGSGEGAL